MPDRQSQNPTRTYKAAVAKSWRAFLVAHQQNARMGLLVRRGAPARDEDLEFVLFASQAAMVITNARRYREERRSRTSLEALVDTSPVGVAVFDVRTGAPTR